MLIHCLMLVETRTAIIYWSKDLFSACLGSSHELKNIPVMNKCKLREQAYVTKQLIFIFPRKLWMKFVQVKSTRENVNKTKLFFLRNIKIAAVYI